MSLHLPFVTAIVAITLQIKFLWTKHMTSFWNILHHSNQLPSVAICLLKESIEEWRKIYCHFWSVKMKFWFSSFLLVHRRDRLLLITSYSSGSIHLICIFGRININNINTDYFSGAGKMAEISASETQYLTNSALNKARPSGGDNILARCTQQSLISSCWVSLSCISILFSWGRTCDRRNFSKVKKCLYVTMFVTVCWLLIFKLQYNISFPTATS